MWKDILKAPPFDAVRYEQQVSTPWKMTFPSFFSQVLDRYIEDAIIRKRTRNPPKGEKRKYKVSFTSEDVEKYEKYLDKMVDEPTPTGRKYYTGFGARDEYTTEFKDKIKQKMLQEYNMDSIRLLEYSPIIYGTFSFEFTLTNEGNAGNMEKVAGAVTTSSPAHSHLFKPTYGKRRKRKKKKEDSE